MASIPQKKMGMIGVVVLAVVLGAVGLFLFVPAVREMGGWFGAKAEEKAAGSKQVPAKLFAEGEDYGLEISDEAIKSLELNPRVAKDAKTEIPLPPMIGTVNYDNDRMFLVRPRFQGEVAEIMEVEEADYPNGPKKKRPLRFGDRVEQGKALAYLWCRDLGEKKAALVDAILSLQLSYDTLTRQSGIFWEGALSLANLKMAERQVQSDINTWRTAERTLKMWKLNDKEIQEIVNEAKEMIDRNVNVKEEAKYMLDRKLDNAGAPADPKQLRDAKIIEKWAKVPVPVPYLPADPDCKEPRKLVVVEKNTNKYDFVDPGRDTPLFRVADMSRLQIWVHPPEEYLPMLRERLKVPGSLKWDIRFQADPSRKLDNLKVVNVSPSLDPYQHTPMLFGYLDNKEEKYLVGQFVTATIQVPAPDNTVEIDTGSINQIRGQSFVFVRTKDKNKFLMKRVVVVQSSREKSWVRRVLTDKDREVSADEVAKGRYRLQSLDIGEAVITRGVVELTEALEELRGQQKEKGDKAA